MASHTRPLTGFYEAVVVQDDRVRTRLSSAPDADAFVARTVEEAAKAGYELTEAEIHARLGDPVQRDRIVGWLTPSTAAGAKVAHAGPSLPGWLRRGS